MFFGSAIKNDDITTTSTSVVEALGGEKEIARLAINLSLVGARVDVKYIACVRVHEKRSAVFNELKTQKHRFLNIINGKGGEVIHPLVVGVEIVVLNLKWLIGSLRLFGNP